MGTAGMQTGERSSGMVEPLIMGTEAVETQELSTGIVGAPRNGNTWCSDPGIQCRKERELDRSVVYALILQVNKDYSSEVNRVTQGDILLKRISRVATSCTSCLWPIASDGTVRVPFILNNAGYSNSDLALIRNAMQEYEALTCARFVSRTTESSYLNITSSGGCFSFVGRTGGAQILQLYSSGCMKRGIIQHELQHALGFYHEITRSDKDSYIIIRDEFIIPEYLNSFHKLEGNTLGLPYDYNSVMHYDRYAYTTNDSEPTIVPTPDPNVPVGQRYGLSDLDVQKINKLYKCNVCSTLLNEESGTFSSTSFATGYPNNMICVWLIRVPNGQVALTFNYFDIQNTAGCVADYIRIYDGPTRNYPLLLDRACGTVQTPTIISSTEQMLIEFVSDGSVPSAGFKASYTTGNFQCSP
ncbi:PREDICTED: astacin-like metalloendopeptidase [Nanorana parkeri]|uniref:astacin-like metalloendopeptidase n=1 Tax=Nanorana parkeri TaxID=125878 RepID=UPI0008547E88|nr:PREDICTED: astacin-like metalloendopeptidase [Nanorana parkeri]